MKDIMKTLQSVIGAPEENRMWMVKHLLKDLKLFCSECETVYKNEAEVFKFVDVEVQEPYDHPEWLTVSLGCPCGYVGGYTFKPNPFIC
jgi:hypothetical protein